MKEGLLEKIKSQGYWRINFQPAIYPTRRLDLGACREAIEENSVRLRGWDYPHVPRRQNEQSGAQPCGDYYEGWVDWQQHKEFWRMYRSHQFLHYLALREDWYGESDWMSDEIKQITPGTVVGVIGTVVYQTTEIFEFLTRLVRNNLYPDGVLADISLDNMKGRQLRIEDPMRGDFRAARATGAETIKVERKCSADELKRKSQEIARGAIVEIFDHFGWHKPPLDQIKLDQEKLLKGL
jgi:hypothetical protein